VVSFYNAVELINVICDVIKHIFRLFRLVTQHLVHRANNKTAAIGIFLKRTPKETAMYCMTTETATLIN